MDVASGHGLTRKSQANCSCETFFEKGSLEEGKGDKDGENWGCYVQEESVGRDSKGNAYAIERPDR